MVLYISDSTSECTLARTVEAYDFAATKHAAGFIFPRGGCSVVKQACRLRLRDNPLIEKVVSCVRLGLRVL